MTQSQLSEKLGVNRATLASYEEGRAEPKFESFQKMAGFFKVSLDDLLLKKLEDEGKRKSWAPKGLQILPIVVDQDEKERINLVSQKASAGYLKGHQDREFVESLPSFNLPFDKTSQGTYRAFEIEGDSMLPIPSGSFIIARYEDQWKSIRDNSPYIVVSQTDGLTYKRVSIDLRKETVLLEPDNAGYDSYSLPLFEISELWQAIGYISFDLSKPTTTNSNSDLDSMRRLLFDLKGEVDQLKKDKN